MPIGHIVVITANIDYDRSANYIIAICKKLHTGILRFLILANGKFSIKAI